jgi:hypothetical protein
MSDVNISGANNGIISVGDNNNNSVNISNQQSQEFDHLTKRLLDEIKKYDLVENEKENLVNHVKTVAEQVKSEKPNNSIIDLLLKGMDMVIKPVELGPAFIQWVSWIKNMFGL